ncbi:MAG TPA: hypothetical protein VMV49_17050 [Candidatus Deferrimicrobium sp.]|nr:hypothetical protein [Candidatus Deferrimicrobium sp.]
MNRNEDDENIFVGIIYSVLVNSKFQPQLWFPKVLDSDKIQNIISRANLYFSTEENWLGKILILPIPIHKFLGLTYFFEEPTGISTRKVMASITILIKESVYDFFYQHIERLKRDLKNYTEELKNTNKKQRVILSQFYYDLEDFVSQYQKIQNIIGVKGKIEETGKQCVLLSYFNSKIGPSPFYCYPENSISQKQQNQLSNELEADSKLGHSFFIKSYSDFNVVHLYFELESHSARGRVEMCLLSLIFDKMPSNEMIEVISFRLFELIDKLYLESEIALGFYERMYGVNENPVKIKQMSDYLRKWVVEVYQSCIESYFERSSERVFAKILMNFTRAKLLEKLSEGPIEVKELKKWIPKNLGKKIDLIGLLSPLIDSDFVMIEDTSDQDSIVLLKGLDVYRIPPISTIEKLKSFSSIYPEIYPDLEKQFTREISQFFQDYKKSLYETVLLSSIIFNPKNFSIISKLRSGSIFFKADFEASFDERIHHFITDNLAFLRQHHIITEITTKSELFILLKTDIKFEITIPKYIILGQQKEDKLPEPLKQVMNNISKTPERIKDIFKRWFS